MALVNDIVIQALRKCRFRNTSDTDRLHEARVGLNLMLKSWGETMIIPTKEELTLVAATASYTIGDGGDFDTDKPISIISAYIDDSAGTSYKVDISMSPKDYDKVQDKDAPARPNKLYYASQYSTGLGKIYFNSAPSSAETFQLTSYKGATEYANLTDTIVQPPEYEKAMVYALAVDMAEELGMVLSPTIVQQAIMLRIEIEKRNRKTPISKFPNALLRANVRI